MKIHDEGLILSKVVRIALAVWAAAGFATSHRGIGLCPLAKPGGRHPVRRALHQRHRRLMVNRPPAHEISDGSLLGTNTHMAVDQGSDLIRKAILTSVDIGKSIAANALICGDEAAVLAYESMTR
jgi:hypothetical protein